MFEGTSCAIVPHKVLQALHFCGLKMVLSHRSVPGVKCACQNLVTCGCVSFHFKKMMSLPTRCILSSPPFVSQRTRPQCLIPVRLWLVVKLPLQPREMSLLQPVLSRRERSSHEQPTGPSENNLDSGQPYGNPHASLQGRTLTPPIHDIPYVTKRATVQPMFDSTTPVTLPAGSHATDRLV